MHHLPIKLVNQNLKFLKILLFSLHIGIQSFCVAAIDNNGQSSTQFCMAMAVGATGTSFVTPTFVQASASPIGTVMGTQRQFSIKGTFRKIVKIVLKVIYDTLFYSECRNKKANKKWKPDSNIRCQQ